MLFGLRCNFQVVCCRTVGTCVTTGAALHVSVLRGGTKCFGCAQGRVRAAAVLAVAVRQPPAGPQRCCDRAPAVALVCAASVPGGHRPSARLLPPHRPAAGPPHREQGLSSVGLALVAGAGLARGWRRAGAGLAPVAGAGLAPPRGTAGFPGCAEGQRGTQHPAHPHRWPLPRLTRALWQRSQVSAYAFYISDC